MGLKNNTRAWVVVLSGLDDSNNNNKGEIMKNYKKKCSHCGSTSTLPIAYGLLSDEVQQENAKEEKYVWGGCVIHINSSPTDYCNDCNKSFGRVTMKDKKKT